MTRFMTGTVATIIASEIHGWNYRQLHHDHDRWLDSQIPMIEIVNILVRQESRNHGENHDYLLWIFSLQQVDFFVKFKSRPQGRNCNEIWWDLFVNGATSSAIPRFRILHICDRILRQLHGQDQWRLACLGVKAKVRFRAEFGDKLGLFAIFKIS